MDPKKELDALMASLPAMGVKIVSKDKSWFKLGKNFTTTLGKTIYTPPGWDTYGDLEKLETITHEIVHVRQMKSMTLPVFLFLYLLAFFPIGLAYFRYVMEREAYVVGFRKYLEYTVNNRAFTRAMLIQHGVDNLTGKNYLWCWPFRRSVRAWFEKNL